MNYPERLDIELTNACQLECIMCPRGIGKMNRPIGFMDWDLFLKIIAESRGKTKHVWAHVFGESLLHPDCDVMIARLSLYGFHVGLSTNCMLLDSERSKSLMTSGLDCLILSLDSLDKKKFEQIRKGANFEQVLENIENCIEVRRQMPHAKTHLLVQIIDFDDSASEIEAAKERFDNKLEGIGEVFLKGYSTYGGTVPAYSSKTSPCYGDSCEMANRALTVLWNGDVTICCHDVNGDYVFGNVNESRIVDLWNSQERKAFHRRICDRNFSDMKMCQNCIGKTR